MYVYLLSVSQGGFELELLDAEVSWVLLLLDEGAQFAERSIK